MYICNNNWPKSCPSLALVQTVGINFLAHVDHVTKLTQNYFFFFSGSADEDSGVGGSPGCNASRPMASNCHSCNVCNKKFSRADILRKHVKTHVNSSCSVCGQIFNDKVALAKHQSEVGPSFDISRFPISDHGLIINLFQLKLFLGKPWEYIRNIFIGLISSNRKRNQTLIVYYI